MPFNNSFRSQFGLRPVQSPRIAGIGSPSGLPAGQGSFGSYARPQSTQSNPARSHLSVNTPVRRNPMFGDVDTQSERGAGYLFNLSPSQEAEAHQSQQYQMQSPDYYDAMSRPSMSLPQQPTPSLFQQPDFAPGPTGNEDQVIGLLRSLGMMR